MTLSGCNAINGRCWTGNLTRPNWPAFQVYALASQNDVTGDGTNYTVQFSGTVLDTNSGFSSSTTYTIPSGFGGRWAFSACVTLQDYSTTTVIVIYLLQNGTNFMRGLYVNTAYADSNQLKQAITWLVPASAGDTFQIRAQAFGPSKTVDVVSGLGSTYFCGVQIA